MTAVLPTPSVRTLLVSERRQGARMPGNMRSFAGIWSAFAPNPPQTAKTWKPTKVDQLDVYALLELQSKQIISLYQMTRNECFKPTKEVD
jgi:hypothetical protein